MKWRLIIFVWFFSVARCWQCAGQEMKDTLAIVSFNDFHGAFAEDAGRPGAARLVQMVLDQKASHPATIVVAGGDNFSGSYFSKITRGEPLLWMFDIMGVEVSAVGNHEFDWGLSFLKDTAARYGAFVSANLTSNGHACLPWAKPYKIVERRLKDGSMLRVAFVGLTTCDTPQKTSPENVRGIQFIHPVGAATDQLLYHLKKEKPVDLVVVLAHIATDQTDPDCITEGNAKALPYLQSVDALITAHSHQVVLTQINHVPIVQAGAHGTHIAKLQFEIRSTNGTRCVSFLRADTIRTTCKPHPPTDRLVHEYIHAYALDEPLTKAQDDLVHDRNTNRFAYTTVGAYVTAAYVECFKASCREDSLRLLPVVGVNHYGGIRSGIRAGTVTRLCAGNVLPFGGDLEAYLFDGARLKRLLQAGRKNKTGFLQSSGLVLTMDGECITHVEVICEGRRQSIEDSTRCIVVLDCFITSGGDGYDAALFSGYEILSFNGLHRTTTTAFIDYLRALGDRSLSTAAAPLPVVRRE